MPGLDAKFHEEKHLALLVAPLFSDGRLLFSPPDKLLRRTSTPSATVMLIDGAKITFNDGASTQVVALDTNPVARLFVDSFLKIFAGDATAMHRLYDMTFTPSTGRPGVGDAWTLHLKPKVDPLRQTITAIDLDGEGVVLHRMQIHELDGDETITTFSNVDPERHFTAEERGRLFTSAIP